MVIIYSTSHKVNDVFGCSGWWDKCGKVQESLLRWRFRHANETSACQFLSGDHLCWHDTHLTMRFPSLLLYIQFWLCALLSVYTTLWLWLVQMTRWKLYKSISIFSFLSEEESRFLFVLFLSEAWSLLSSRVTEGRMQDREEIGTTTWCFRPRGEWYYYMVL